MAVERKYERDIDILLAEEFSVSPKFGEWFLARTRFRDHSGVVTNVFVSKSNADGESDLVIVYTLDQGSKVAILIEDKVDHTLEPEQARRYRKRADREVQEGSFQDFEVFLCAPRAYTASRATPIVREVADAPALLDDDIFDRFLSYEEIADALTAIEDSPRSRYRAAFIRTAAERRVNLWVRVQDNATDAFREAIYQLAVNEYPMLEMKRQPGTKNNNYFTIRPADFRMAARNTRIEIKGPAGTAKKTSCYVDLMFGNTISDQFESSVGTRMPSGMTVLQTGASTAIRIETPVFDIQDGIEVALPRARLAMEAAKRLIEFYRNNRDSIDSTLRSQLK